MAKINAAIDAGPKFPPAYSAGNVDADGGGTLRSKGLVLGTGGEIPRR